MIVITNFVRCQNFGCFDEKAIIQKSNNSIYEQTHFIDNSRTNINWEQFLTNPNHEDGLHVSYSFDDYTCDEYVKMQGFIECGLKEGIWKLYISQTKFLTGLYVKGNREGLWTLNYLINEKAPVCIAEIEFRNNLLHGETKFYFETGELEESIEYENGAKDGIQIEYSIDNNYENIFMNSMQEYSNGLLNGRYLSFHYRSHDTLEYGHYSEGLRSGRFFLNYDRIRQYIDFDKGNIDGRLIRYHRNGILELELEYKRNLPFNIIQNNDSNGNSLSLGMFQDGTGILNLYYPDGSLLSSAEYKNQLISGKYTNYYPSGKIKEDGIMNTVKSNISRKILAIERCQDLNMFSSWSLNYIQGTKYTYFNEDGSINQNIQIQSTDTNNNEFTIVDKYSNNKLKSKETTLNGLKQGRVMYYDDNGKIEMIGNFKIIEIDSIKSSIKDGVFQYFYPNDSIRAEITYCNGKETGKSNFYDEDGELVRIKVNDSNGSSFSILKGDTVNIIDNIGQKQGKWVSLNNDNCVVVPEQVKYYKNDKPVGTWLTFSPYNNQILEERITWQDSLHAFCERFNHKGQIFEKGTLIHNVENGEWKRYDTQRGILKFKGEYVCGRKNGIWLTFNRKGKIIKRTEYKNDKIINVH
jgi:antitoxin component YwqK of YwqJK toxin-antitoxin module